MKIFGAQKEKSARERKVNKNVQDTISGNGRRRVAMRMGAR